jgi:DNA-binding response OmpR family regulator
MGLRGRERKELVMRTQNTSPGAHARIEPALVGAGPATSLPRSASIHVLKSATKAGQRLVFVPSAQRPPTLRNEMVELVADIDGLPVLVRLLVNELSAGCVGKDDDIPSLLSSTLNRIVDRMGGSPLRSDAASKQPLATVELIAGKESLVPAPPSETSLRVGPLELDLLDRTARRGDRKIDLRPREFQLLKYMMQRSGRLLTRATLLQEVWHYRFVPETNLVDVHMGRLRRKVDGANELPMIRNFRGAGFVLGAPAVSPDSQPTPAERSVLSLFQKERRNANRQHEPQHAT